MKREQLIRDLRKTARKAGVKFNVNIKHGKGSHYVVTFGPKTTTIKSGELTPGYAALIKRQLGLK